MAQVRAESLQRALPSIAGFITGKTGIRVVRGERAATDGKVIYLPKFDDLSLTHGQVAKAVAFIYHESGHILHTTFGTRSENTLERAIEGVLEDIRIEQQMMRTHPAARRYLNELVDAFTAAGLEGAATRCFHPMSEMDSEGRVLQAYMLYRLRHDVLHQRGVAPVLAPTAEAAVKKFPPGMMVRLDALMFQVEQCESTADVQSLAFEIVKMVKEEKQEEQKRQEQQQPQQQAGGDGDVGAQSGNQGDGQGNSQGDDQGGSFGAGKQQASGADNGEGQTSAADRQAGDGEVAQTASSGAGGTGSGDLDALLAMGEDEIQQSVGDMLADELDQVACQQGGSLVSMPNVHKLRLRDGSAPVAALKASINAIRTKTLQWMASATETEESHAKAGLMLDFARLHEARLGGNIFVSRTEGIDLNAAISIVIDRSGSMCCAIQSAAQAAVAAMMAFDVPGIETQVSVFPAYGTVGDQHYDEGIAVVKRWEESPARLAGRIASLTTDGGTPMAEAILFATADLVRRPETLKLVMVVTDGEPNDPVATRRVIERARQSGVTVVGLGIGVNPVPVFGERYSAPLHDVGELSAAMVRLIKTSMSYH